MKPKIHLPKTIKVPTRRRSPPTPGPPSTQPLQQQRNPRAHFDKVVAPTNSLAVASRPPAAPPAAPVKDKPSGKGKNCLIISKGTPQPKPASRFSSLGGERSPSPIGPIPEDVHIGPRVNDYPLNSTFLAYSFVGYESHGTSSENIVPATQKRSFSIPKASFKHLVYSITECYSDLDLRWQKESLDILHEIAEAYLMRLFGVANALAIHRRRISVGLDDLRLAVALEELFEATALVNIFDKVIQNKNQFYYSVLIYFQM